MRKSTDEHKRAGLQAHAPEVCVLVVEGTDRLRVVMKVAQWGVNDADGCGRIVTDDLSHRGYAQWVDHEEKEECPDKPREGPRVATARRRGVALQFVAHSKGIGAWVAAVKGRTD